MEWLLILSALLNAATGGFVGSRAADSSPRHEAAVEAAASAQSVAIAVVAVVRPLVSASWNRAPANEFPQAAQVVAFRLPLETDRLIE